jgi:hypothetical protein
MREQLRALDQHNPLVPLALGLLALDRRFEALIAPEVAEEAPGLPDDDVALALFLGIASVHRTLHRWLAHGCPAENETGDDTSGAGAVDFDSVTGLGR